MSVMGWSTWVRQARRLMVSSCCLMLAIHGVAGPSLGQSQVVERVAGKPLFRAGAFASNITPPLGEPIVGNFDTPAATHIHDELHARCIVLDDGKTRLAFAICDNVGIPREVFDAAKKLVQETTGIPSDHILMSATHSHSATTARGENALVADKELVGYQQFLVRRIADGIRQAADNLAPAQIGWGAVDVPSQVFNRRWHLKPGTPNPNPFGGEDKVKMNPGSGAATLLEPAGPTDPQVSFLSLRSLDGRPIALLANYSLHYVGGVPLGHVSADYFAVFADRMQQLLKADRLEPPFVGIMSNGTSGDVNNINFRTPGEPKAPYQKMREVADEVADAVFKAHSSITFHNWVELGAAQRELTLGVRKPTEAQRDYALKVLAKPANAKPTGPHERAYADRVLLLYDSPSEVQVLLQTFRLGDLGIAAIPFEVFTESGLEIKQKSPFKPSFTIELANGSYGYLPTPRHHALGGYETWMGTNKVEVEASEKIVKTLLDLFAGLKNNGASSTR
ncbi:neutral/alkaline non-lysosomal ceramidase N-terminal domain-containing protein [Singulisphaera acidiphila]|uniref:Neutral/alkaline non-lysosomal ceramidase n=1 Tax=Singulisphaera acidiphila (strain ATCC BAA-1392 / DSM 18658 / VKM B-2454 / MOB10) TaxID=886293 RepID=L0DQ42_SINAD|nr:neutral/alkaline non-lysosomal ceramidase N-terminal domain-containing protein [Singulisphaera acidiphila]AGA30816.1 Neutral/alkaline non-lysosomal ceramidase [Singulisphaera acidiphila DSM 18658]